MTYNYYNIIENLEILIIRRDFSSRGYKCMVK